MIIDYHYNLSASEQLTQGNFDFIIGDGFHYIQIGDTTVSQLKKSKNHSAKIIQWLYKKQA